MKETVLKIRDQLVGFWNKYKKSKLAWLIFVVIVVIIFFIAKGKGALEDGVIATVTKQDIVESVILSGRTQSASAVQLGFADSGRVSQVLVKEGDVVYQGQLLASLDVSDLYVNDIKKIKQEQDALVANAYRNLLSLGLEMIPEDSIMSGTPPTITGVYTGPEGEYYLQMYSSAAPSGVSFRLSGLENGITQSIIANTAVPLGTRGLYIEFPENDFYERKRWIVAIPNKRSSDYSTYLNAYEYAKATRERVIADTEASNASVYSKMNRRRIYAPFSGTVASVGIKTGESTNSSVNTTDVSSGTITLISPKDYEVVLKVPEVSIAKLTVGMTVDITLDAYGDTEIFPGIITTINPAETLVDGVPVYETRVVFTKEDPRIRSGMTATATIVTNKKEGVLAVPANMIQSTKNGSVVNVLIDDKKTEARQVTTGIRGSDSMIEIITGLVEGDRVSSEPL